MPTQPDDGTPPNRGDENRQDVQFHIGRVRSGRQEVEKRLAIDFQTASATAEIPPPHTRTKHAILAKGERATG
jgi:hypothetical protein